jgi:hypothetical protein
MRFISGHRYVPLLRVTTAYSNELFNYSTISKGWTKLDAAAGVTGTVPSARHLRAIVTVGEDIYVFAGDWSSEACTSCVAGKFSDAVGASVASTCGVCTSGTSLKAREEAADSDSDFGTLFGVGSRSPRACRSSGRLPTCANFCPAAPTPLRRPRVVGSAGREEERSWCVGGSRKFRIVSQPKLYYESLTPVL